VRAVAAVGAASLAALGGCSSQWFQVYAHPDIARTDLVVRTEPAGATVVLVAEDGAKRQEVAPFRVPIEYDHVETMYERQNNYGSQMREGMSPVVQVLTFPVWGIASFIHFREEKRRHEYGHNKFAATAFASGRADAEETIVLEGEAEHPVTLKLPPLK